MKVLGIIVLILLLISLLRLGVLITLGEKTVVKICVGLLRITLPEGDKGEKKPKKKKKKKEKGEKGGFPKPTVSDIIDLVRTAVGALGATCRRLCKRLLILPLRLHVSLGGDDPASIGNTYGYANAALWTLMPKIEELFNIPAPYLLLEPDFSGEKTRVEGDVGVSLRVCDLFAIVFALAIPLVKWYLRFCKAHKNDPKQAESKPNEKKTEEKLSA